MHHNHHEYDGSDNKHMEPTNINVELQLTLINQEQACVSCVCQGQPLNFSICDNCCEFDFVSWATSHTC